MTKLPIKETYDGDLLEGIQLMDEMIDQMLHLINRRLAYEDWPSEYQIAEELKIITAQYKQRLLDADA